MRLYALDCLLEGLERLNELEVAGIPPTLQDQLESAGIDCPPGITATRLIECVFEAQEVFVGQGGKECDRLAKKGKAPGCQPGASRRVR